VTQAPKAALPGLEVRYSVLYLTARMMACIGGALAFGFAASQLKYPHWFAAINYGMAAMLVGIATISTYRLLMARSEVVVSINAAGFRDARLTPTLIPWSAVQSVHAYTYRGRKANRVALWIDPAFRRGLSIRLGARLYYWASLSFGSSFEVDVGVLEAEAVEIAQAAQPFLAKKV